MGTQGFRPWYVWALLVGGALTALLLLMLTAAGVWQLRVQAVAGAERTQQTLVEVLTHDLSRGLDVIDTALVNAPTIVHPPPTTQDVARAYRPFVERLTALPYVEALTLTDAGGRVLYTSQPDFGVRDLSERPYFRLLRTADPGSRVLIGPLDSIVDGRPIIIAARRIDDADGRFLGLALARLAPEYLQRVLWDITLPDSVSVRIDDARGMPLALSASRSDLPWSQTLGAADAVVEDGWILSGRSIGDGALTVSVVTDLSESLRHWRGSALVLGGAGTAGAAIVVGLTLVLTRTVRRLGLSEEKFRRAFHSTPDAMSLTRLRDGRYVEVNEGFLRMSGYARDEIVGHTALEIGIWGDADQRSAVLGKILAGEAVQGAEATFIVKGGRLLHGLMSGTLIDIDGEPHLLAFTRDISDRKEQEDILRRTVDQLVASNSELQNFAHVASHDLQEPLRSIVSYSQLIQRRADSLPPDLLEDFDFVIAAGKRMHALVNDLLAYSRLSTRAKPFVRVHGAAAVRAALDNLSQMIADAGATVEVRPLPELRVDEVQAVQVFQNLISNAIKFQPPGKPARVTVSAEVPPEGRFARFTVADDGIGIPAGSREKVFDIFRRLHGDRDYPGTGIGLTICRRIVERHGGTIAAESGPEGGTAFVFTLPLWRDEDQGGPEPETEQ